MTCVGLSNNTLVADVITYGNFNSAVDFGPEGVIVLSTHTGNPTSLATEIIGEPGGIRLTTTVSTPGSGTYAHFVPAMFDPSSLGAINFIDYSIRLRDPDLGSRQDGATSTVRMMLHQDGMFFYGPSFLPDGVGDFLTFTARADLADFEAGNGLPFGTASGVNPTFSTSGSELTFALAVDSATAGPTPIRIVDLEDFSISVDFEPAAVPEPSSAILCSLLTMACAARFVGKKRRTKQESLQM